MPCGPWVIGVWDRVVTSVRDGARPGSRVSPSADPAGTTFPRNDSTKADITMSKTIVICSPVPPAIGGFGGSLEGTPAAMLGAGSGFVAISPSSG